VKLLDEKKKEKDGEEQQQQTTPTISITAAGIITKKDNSFRQ
jgi:hypothetical protein